MNTSGKRLDPLDIGCRVAKPVVVVVRSGGMLTFERIHHASELGRHVPIEEEPHAAMLLSKSTAAMTCLECTLYQSATSSASWSFAS
jgi:hypothetical protein